MHFATLAFEVAGFKVRFSSVVIGLLNGIPIGLLAIGLVLIYRVSRFINFAQGAMGVFGASIVGTLALQYGFPYWFSFAVGVLAAAGASAGAEAAMIRRLDKLPRLVGVVATLGLAQLVLAIAFQINTKARSGITFPKPPGMPTFNIGNVLINQAYTGMMIISPILLIVLHRVLRSGRLGLAIRGTASNADAAWTSGISPHRTTTLTWAIAGGVAAISATLLWPTQGFATIDSLGPALLLRGLGAALIGRLRSVVWAFAGALGIGLVDFLLRVNQQTTKYVDAVLGIIVIVAILFETVGGRTALQTAHWNRISLPPVEERYRGLPTVRRGAVINTLIGVFFCWVALVKFLDNAKAFAMVTAMAYAIVAMSVTILAGVGGMLSLGQFAIAGFGAAASVAVVRESGGNIALGLLAAAAVGAVACLVLAVPSLLRPRNMVLEVTSLAVAIASASFILGQSWALGESGVKPGRPKIGSIRFDIARNYYWFAIACVVVALGFAHLYRRSRIGRELLATRDNPQAASAMGIPVTKRRAQAMLVAGALAGFGGAVMAHSRSTIVAQDFPATASIVVVVIAALAGLGSLSFTTAAASVVVGVPLLITDNDTVMTIISLAWLMVIVLSPRGLAGGGVPLRNWAHEESGRRRGILPEWEERSIAAANGLDVTVPPPVQTGVQPIRLLRLRDYWRAAPSRVETGPLLDARGLSKSFGGVRAVDGVDLQVQRGEIVGIVGPNGAGKTTTFEILTGFVRPDGGSVRFDGIDISRLTPEERSAAGIVRSFQNALLYPTLTVRETLELAARSAPGVPSGRRSATRAERVGSIDSLMEALGIARFADTVLGSVPTGARRMTETGCALILQPAMVLLDEPSAGIPHDEIEALSELLRNVRDGLGVTLVIVDHDLRLLSRTCDRMVAMHLGAVIATGTPAEVTADPNVIEAYVGSSDAARTRAAVAGPT